MTDEEIDRIIEMAWEDLNINKQAVLRGLKVRIKKYIKYNFKKYQQLCQKLFF